MQSLRSLRISIIRGSCYVPTVSPFKISDTFTWNVIQDHDGQNLLKKTANIWNFLVALSWVESSWNTCSEKVSKSKKHALLFLRGWIRENRRFFLVEIRLDTANASFHEKNVLLQLHHLPEMRKSWASVMHMKGVVLL